MKYLLVAGLTMGAFSTAFAALPPYWQSAAEISAIAQSPEVAEELRTDQPIKSIEREKDDRMDNTTGDRDDDFGRDRIEYTVKAGRCKVEVKIIYGRSIKPGPVPFRILVGERHCDDDHGPRAN